MKNLYGKVIKTGWVIAVAGGVTSFAGIKIARSTGNDNFFALMVLGALLVITGIVMAAVYGAMEKSFSRAAGEGVPLLRFTLSGPDYFRFAGAQAEEIRQTNKMSLIIALVFCGLLAVAGPLFVKENGALFSLFSLGLGLFLIVACWLATAYRVNKLKNGDKEVILTPESAYVGDQFHFWRAPASSLREAVFLGAGEHRDNPRAVLRITYSAVTGTGTTPYTLLIPVPVGMEEKAKAAARTLQDGAKPPAG